MTVVRTTSLTRSERALVTRSVRTGAANSREPVSGRLPGPSGPADFGCRPDLPISVVVRTDPTSNPETVLGTSLPEFLSRNVPDPADAAGLTHKRHDVSVTDLRNRAPVSSGAVRLLVKRDDFGVSDAYPFDPIGPGWPSSLPVVVIPNAAPELMGENVTEPVITAWNILHPRESQLDVRFERDIARVVTGIIRVEGNIQLTVVCWFDVSPTDTNGQRVGHLDNLFAGFVQSKPECKPPQRRTVPVAPRTLRASSNRNQSANRGATSPGPVLGSAIVS